MEALYNETNALIEEVDSGVEQIEKADDRMIAKELLQKLDRAMINCERLNSMVVKEPESRQPSTQMRVNQLKYDCLHFRAAIEILQQKRCQQQQQTEEEHAAMLGSSWLSEQDSDSTPFSTDPALKHRSRMTAAHSCMDNQQTRHNAGPNLRGCSVVQKGFLHRTDQKVVMLLVGLSVACGVMVCVWHWPV